MNSGWREIDIHVGYLLAKLAFGTICECKNNRRKWRHLVFTWCHGSTVVMSYAKSEKSVLGDNCEMSDRWLFLAELCVQDIKECVRNKMIHLLPWITILFTRDVICQWFWLVTLENHWQITSLTSPKNVIHGNPCIILYIFSHWLRLR